MVYALREASVLVLALQLTSLVVCLVGSSVRDHSLALTGGSQRCVYKHSLIIYMYACTMYYVLDMGYELIARSAQNSTILISQGTAQILTQMMLEFITL